MIHLKMKEIYDMEFDVTYIKMLRFGMPNLQVEYSQHASDKHLKEPPSIHKVPRTGAQP